MADHVEQHFANEGNTCERGPLICVGDIVELLWTPTKAFSRLRLTATDTGCRVKDYPHSGEIESARGYFLTESALS
jgi:hypothetical protein